MNLAEQLKGKVIVNLYPAIETPHGLVADKSQEPSYKIVEGADSAQICEEDWMRLPNGDRQVVGQCVFQVIGGELVPVDESF